MTTSITHIHNRQCTFRDFVEKSLVWFEVVKVGSPVMYADGVTTPSARRPAMSILSLPDFLCDQHHHFDERLDSRFVVPGREH